MSVWDMPNPSAKAGISRSSSRFCPPASWSLLFFGSLSPPMPSRGESGSRLYVPSLAMPVEGGSMAEMVNAVTYFLKLYSRFLISFPVCMCRPEFSNLG